MPELPEVETVRARLEPKLVGHRFQHVEIFDERLTRPFDPTGVAAELEGERVAALDRRGKYLVVRFESGRVLLIHLRMTGNLLHDNGRSAPVGEERHRRAVVRLDDGSDVVYRDMRRFGTWLLVEPDELEPYLSGRLGGDPLGRSFTAKRLEERLAGRRAPVKAVLLDQRRLAGVGNIYADEALWRARIHPLRAAGDLDDAELRALHRGIRAALHAGIARQGATISSYRTPDGSPGRMQQEFRVYGREGEPCDRCGTPIEKIRAAGRGTYYCPRCQPSLRTV
ncbi:MAG TPA: bifunctional DNA-formamidopyrimidine glycosylase/DNA-(apurinic or apyrimidinic site) lyase [Gaiellaceae bacterium]|nr:bifunctional DNA-formamidopyrimidine glycosylase/DNA-(apurinic or apyrimidinic site) lyase [Gaiellaceae bacterium]